MNEDRDALGMLHAFASVGADRFDITLTNIEGGLTGFRRAQSLESVRRSIPTLLDTSHRLQCNVIVRPRGSIALVQLDDLDAKKLARIAPVSFLTMETSPGNHQAWVAVFAARNDTSNRLRRGIGSDLGASGASRLAGTRNYKPKYAPDFPTIMLLESAPARVVTEAQLHDMGLLAEPTHQPWIQRVRHGAPRRWPDYQRVLDGAPVKQDGSRDISRADFLWCRIAAQAGWSAEAVAAKLMEISSKAKRDGERYAIRTATNAASSIHQAR